LAVGGVCVTMQGVHRCILTVRHPVRSRRRPDRLYRLYHSALATVAERHNLDLPKSCLSPMAEERSRRCVSSRHTWQSRGGSAIRRDRSSGCRGSGHYRRSLSLLDSLPADGWAIVTSGTREVATARLKARSAGSQDHGHGGRRHQRKPDPEHTWWQKQAGHSRGALYRGRGLTGRHCSGYRCRYAVACGCFHSRAS